MKIKEYLIDHKQIFVIDNLFTYNEISRMFLTSTQRPFTKNNVDNHHLNNKQIDAKWTCSFSKDDISKFGLKDKLHQRIPFIKNIIDTKEHHIEQYINYSTPTTIDKYHTDYETDSIDSNMITLLYYANETWDINWAGETLFYTDDLEDIGLAVYPKPGRVIAFDGRIVHSARPPSACAGYARYTIATKLKYKN